MQSNEQNLFVSMLACPPILVNNLYQVSNTKEPVNINYSIFKK